MEKEQFRINPMLPRGYSARQRAKIRQKEKELFEERTEIPFNKFLEEDKNESKPKTYTKTITKVYNSKQD